MTSAIIGLLIAAGIGMIFVAFIAAETYDRPRWHLAVLAIVGLMMIGGTIGYAIDRSNYCAKAPESRCDRIPDQETDQP